MRKIKGLPVQAITSDQFNELQASISGPVLRVHDEQAASSHIYGKLQSGPQPVVRPAVPQLVAVCRTSNDAANALQWAIAHNIKVAVKSSGHHWAGLALAEGGLTVDLSTMQGVEVDEAAGVVKVQPGATAAAVLAALTPRGLFTSVPNLDMVGAGGGFVLGGGMGDSTKTIGFACDNAVAFKAVIASPEGARLAQVDAEHEPELYWGLRGAGLTLALVTSVSLRLHPFIPRSTLLKASFPITHAPQVFDFWRKHDPALPRRHVSMVSFSGSSPTVHLREQLWESRPHTNDTDTTHLQEAVDFVRSNGAVAPAMPVCTPYSELRQFTVPEGLAIYVTDLFLHEVTDQVVDVLVQAATAMTSEMSVISLVRPSDACDAASHNTAFGWRGKPYVSIMALWPRTSAGAAHDGDAKHISWARSIYQQLQPFMAGRYINTVMFDNADDMQHCYQPDDWQRLQKVKAQYDPHQLFRSLHYHQPIGEGDKQAVRGLCILARAV